MKKNYLECGKIRSPHGVRGAVSVEVWCDSPKVLASAKRVYTLNRTGEYKELSVESASALPDRAIMTFSGITSREAAQGYKNVIIYLKREDIPIPPGAMLIADMIGLPVIDVDTGRVYGEISEVTDGVRTKLYTVKTPTGEVILPGVDEFVKEITEDGGMLVRPIPGFFED
jgi:16S rRNA processing protein RimM